jgi:hypothetical protein
MTTTQTEEDVNYDPKCNTCGCKESDYRFGKDFCLRHGCECMAFAKKGMPNILDTK